MNAAAKQAQTNDWVCHDCGDWWHAGTACNAPAPRRFCVCGRRMSEREYIEQAICDNCSAAIAKAAGEA